MSPSPNEYCWQPLREFKARFHRLRALHKEYLADEMLRVTVQMDGGVGDIRLTTPPEEEIQRFALLIYPFAHPDGDLFFPRMAQSLTDTTILSLDEKSRLEASCKQAQRVPLKIDGSTISGPDLFLLIADGGLLTSKPEQVQRVGQLIESPEVGPPILFVFHSYCQAVFGFLEFFYDLLTSLEDRQPTIAGSLPTLGSPTCIYCLRKDVDFSTVEHIYPESLGNKELVLPCGAVCDDCNHGVLSQLDQYLVEHELISLPRLFFVTTNPKTGRYLTASSQHIKARRVGPQKIVLTDHGLSRAAWRQLEKGTLNWTGKNRFDAAKLGRSLYKIGLGLVAHHVGHIAALDPRYNEARGFIMGSRGFANNLLLLTEYKLNPRISGIVVHKPDRTTVTLSIFGVELHFSLEIEPKVDSTGDFAGFPVEVFDLGC